MDSKKIISSYARFVPHQLIELLEKDDVTELQLGVQVERKVSILFTDIRNFTTLSESLTPQENFNFINSFLSQMVPLISVNDGIVDKFIGDAIMAIFPKNADDAVQCAIQMHKQLCFYNEGRKRAGYTPIRVGIGVNTGMAMIGTVGGYNRMEATVISDAVNLASRMETMTKRYNVDLLISENTYNNISDTYKEHMRFVDRTRVKGKLQPQSIYEVFYQDPPLLRDQKKARKALFEEAMAHYHLKKIDKCEQLLLDCLKDDQGDHPAQIYLERCRNFEKHGFHEGAYELSKKIKWSNLFTIQEPNIDEQHKYLVENALELIEISKTENRSAYNEELKTLKKISMAHFKYEEELMEKTSYPFLEHQKGQHQYMVKEFLKLEIQAQDNSISMPFLTFKTQILLVDWIINHTLKEDRHLGRHLQNNT